MHKHPNEPLWYLAAERCPEHGRKLHGHYQVGHFWCLHKDCGHIIETVAEGYKPNVIPFAKRKEEIEQKRLTREWYRVQGF